MGIIDDTFDVEEVLEGTPMAAAFDRILEYIARVETELDELRPKVFMDQHDNGDDATAELELLDQALANSEGQATKPEQGSLLGFFSGRL